MKMYDLSGVWQCEIPGQQAPITLPGTLDEARIGYPDLGGKKWHPDNDTNAALYQTDSGIRTRLTRVCTYEGPAHISRKVTWPLEPGKRLFVECERSRHLRLMVNGREAEPFVPRSLSAPTIFEVTDMMTGDDAITFISDNSYPGWPHDDIVFSSAATDETQTNWNGLLGYLRIRAEEATFLHALHVRPTGGVVNVEVVVSASDAGTTRLSLTSEALVNPLEMDVTLSPGINSVRLDGLPLRDDVRRWDEEEGNLYEMTASIPGSVRTERFGVRDFRAEDGVLKLNGRRIFVRSEANCAVFPETGYCPMTVDAWRHILSVYRSYGVNMMRFHSHTPPEAAFAAADELGMLMQAELSHWNPQTAFETDESMACYTAELTGTLAHLANHPSFVMLTFGNELACGELGHERMGQLLALAKRTDPTRLYACASNAHYGWYGSSGSSDVYTSTNLGPHQLRAAYANMEGYLNHRYPSADSDYESAMAEVRKVSSMPVISFEVGQFEVLPDFDEIDCFRGITCPVNLKLIRDKVKAEGLLKDWKKYVEASGELSNLCYREEVEAALRTERMSGISLLGIQDFPGQGTALVGMLNSHLLSKPFDFARPERFRKFFRSVLPLVLLEKYTYTCGEVLTAPVKLANYAKEAIAGMPRWELRGEDICLRGRLDAVTALPGRLTPIGSLSIPLPEMAKPQKLMLTLRMGSAENTYPVWVYPKANPVCPENVLECRSLDANALSCLQAGGTVYLAPDSTAESIPGSIQAQFSTDFWSVGTFPTQSGAMGQYIHKEHPIFTAFPTEHHTNWQWWPMASQRAMCLPRRLDAIIEEMDSYAYLRPMAQLVACRCNGGRLLISSMGLHDLQQYPEARALQQSIYTWLASAKVWPEQELTVEEVQRIIH